MIRGWLRTSKRMMMRMRRTQTQTQTVQLPQHDLCSCRHLSSSCCQKAKRKKKVNSESVRSTLWRCQSDLITLSFFLWSAQRHRHDSEAFDHMVTVFRRLTLRYETVPALLYQLETIGCASLTNPKSALVLLRIYWRAGMHHMLIEAYDYLRTAYEFVPDTFARNLHMDALFRIREPYCALSVFMDIHPPNFFTFNIALIHLSNLNHLSLIPLILRDMLTSGYYPTPVTFHMLLRFFCNMTTLMEAYQLLGLMVTLGIKFSVSIWTILIHKHCKLGRLDVANKLLLNMAQTGCPPNVVTYTTLFKAFMESDRVHDASLLLRTMLSAGHVPDLILYNVLIDLLSKAGKYQDAINVFNQLSKQNIKPDVYTFTSLLSTICVSRMFYPLPKLSRHIDPDLVFCNALLSYLVKADRPSHAVEFYNHMVNEGFEPDKYSFAGLLSALCAVGRIGKAVNVYRDIIMDYNDTDAHIHTEIIDAHIHTVIIGELIKAGKYHKATSIFNLAVKNEYPLDNIAYTAVICALLRCERTQEARILYDQMKDNGLKPNVHAYNTMLFNFSKKQDLQMIKQILQEMIDSRMELSDRNFFTICKYPCSLDIYLSALKLRALNIDRHTEGVQANFKHNAEANTEWNLDLDSSGSEDLSDVAASVG